MATSTIQCPPLSSNSTTAVTYNGLTFRYWKYGNVVTVACTDGKCSAAKAASTAIGTLPVGYRPMAQINMVNTSLPDTTERWIINVNGEVMCSTAITANQYVRFYATYVCANA